jgi:IclR family acetate operon transcriptional repressor
MNPDRYLRTFDILNLLVSHKEGLRLTEIKEALKLPVSSVHNVLQTMVAAEVLVVDEDLRYFVGPRTVSLALRTVHALDVRSLARRPLQDLAREIGDDVYLGLRMGSRVVYADRILGTQRISLDIRLGESLFLHSTATGKLFAAFDDRLAAGVMGRKLPKLTATTITSAEGLAQEYARIREQGFAKSQEESTEGVVGYAVPIRSADGQLAAAVHVSVMLNRATKPHERKLLSKARLCASQIERLLGNVRQETTRPWAAVTGKSAAKQAVSESVQ